MQGHRLGVIGSHASEQPAWCFPAASESTELISICVSGQPGELRPGRATLARSPRLRSAAPCHCLRPRACRRPARESTCPAGGRRYGVRFMPRRLASARHRGREAESGAGPQPRSRVPPAEGRLKQQERPADSNGIRRRYCKALRHGWWAIGCEPLSSPSLGFAVGLCGESVTVDQADKPRPRWLGLGSRSLVEPA